MTSKITLLATSLINGNISYTKEKLKRYSKIEFINFIEEYALISGDSIQESLNRIKRFL